MAICWDLVDNWDRDTDDKDTHWTRIASDKAKIGGNCNFSVLDVYESEYALFSLLASHCAVAERCAKLGKLHFLETVPSSDPPGDSFHR
jgi:hypothetical protein